MFRWLGSAWSRCERCDRLAWDHEQSDPIADIRNALYAAAHGHSTQRYPPVMAVSDEC